jgi:hypothetical protein
MSTRTTPMDFANLRPRPTAASLLVPSTCKNAGLDHPSRLRIFWFPIQIAPDMLVLEIPRRHVVVQEDSFLSIMIQPVTSPQMEVLLVL